MTANLRFHRACHHRKRFEGLTTICYISSYDSSDDSRPEGKRSRLDSTSSSKKKKHKKHKKHKKSSRSEREAGVDGGGSDLKSKKHKKHKRKHKSSVGSGDSSDTGRNSSRRGNNGAGGVSSRKSGGLSEKFTDIMEKVGKNADSVVIIEKTSNGHTIAMKKPNIPTDPSSLVEEITRTLNAKAIPSMEIVSSESESDV